ncbi:3-phosphoserine/phosphohydroxythreonine transaminase [Alteribacter natronophilus]|uniref:3-phosphoserine/phosphohydroxythreonine transaminase n=1 Tax=Alteribacter natronophilus TaxID=2583810 RepID=UPI00110D4A66|nr:3-phosphoserine/phosphohydroxythreonine transaminase [Alteribacter natronophilus]TMW74004.1 3-phosphoserine/phosphohydroxythreonine transaminase [Alteribacter natronophilus]
MYNFNPGPAALPAEVKERIRQEGLAEDLSVMEMSHRSKEYEAIHFGTKEKIRALLRVPQDFDILFLQGGASLQFAMLPMNFLTPGKKAGYVLTGAWAEKAYEEASRLGDTYVYASGADGQYRSIPAIHTWDPQENTAYLHLTTNNTVYGTQWYQYPDSLHNVPVVADMSSDIFSRPVDWSKVDIAYAGAQKNAGPAGLTIVIIKKDWLEEAEQDIPKILSYQTHHKKNSLYHTPPTYSIYVTGLVMDWLDSQGGVEKIYRQNAKKAGRVYDLMDQSHHFYQPHAEKLSRSMMNVTFRLPSMELESLFLRHAAEERLLGLKGHRSVGGCRISLYNAVTPEAVEHLHSFMLRFLEKHSC